MATWTEERTKTFVAGEALAAYRRVKLGSTAGEVVYADAADFAFIGFTINAVSAGDTVTVALGSGTGTFLCTAAGTFTAHSAIYPAADGKIDDSGSVPSIGTALDAATTIGDVVEIMPWPVTATSDHETRITTAESDIDTLQTDLGTAEGEIDTLQTNLGTAEGDIDALEAADILTFEAGEALEANRLVKLSAGTAVYADAADGASVIGVTTAAAESAADVTVKRINGNGKFEVESADTFAVGAPVYVVADGKVDDAGTTLIGIASEAAAVAGDLVDVIITPWPEALAT